MSHDHLLEVEHLERGRSGAAAPRAIAAAPSPPPNVFPTTGSDPSAHITT